MIDIEFQLNGRKIRPNDIGNQLEKAMFSQVRDNIAGKLHGIHDPESGSRPKVIVKEVLSTIYHLKFPVHPSLSKKSKDAFDRTPTSAKSERR